MDKTDNIFLFYDSGRGFTALLESGQSLYWSTAQNTKENFLEAKERLKRIFQEFKVVCPRKNNPYFILSIERYKTMRAKKDKRTSCDLKDY